MPCATWRKYDKAFACVRPAPATDRSTRVVDRLTPAPRPQDWLNDRLVVLGTKCNHLLLLDVVSAEVREVPLPHVSVQRQVAPELQSAMAQLPPSPRGPSLDCGIHAVSLSPDGSFLATGGAHVHDCQVFAVHAPPGAHSGDVYLTPATTLVVRPGHRLVHGSAAGRPCRSPLHPARRSMQTGCSASPG